MAKSHSCSDGVVQSVSHKRTCVTRSDSESLLVLMPVRKPEAENSYLDDMSGTGASAQVQSSRGHQMWHGGGADDASIYCEDL